MEFVLGLFLLSFLVLMIFNLFPSSLFAIRHSEARSLADSVAQSYLHRERTRPFDELSLGERRESVELEQTTLDVVITVSQVPDSDPEFLKSIRVEVRWNSRQGSKSVLQELWISRARR